jgi:hypothetical protein
MPAMLALMVNEYELFNWHLKNFKGNREIQIHHVKANIP